MGDATFTGVEYYVNYVNYCESVRESYINSVLI